MKKIIKEATLFISYSSMIAILWLLILLVEKVIPLSVAAPIAILVMLSQLFSIPFIDKQYEEFYKHIYITQRIFSVIIILTLVFQNNVIWPIMPIIRVVLYTIYILIYITKRTENRTRL